jgi:hypothetical protein
LHCNRCLTFGHVVLGAMLMGTLCVSVNSAYAQRFQTGQSTQALDNAGGTPGIAPGTAGDRVAHSPPEFPTEYDLGGLVRRTVAVSCFLAAACLGCFIWAHFRHGRPFARSPTTRQMELLESIVVAPRCFLHLVLVDGQRFLVARDPSGFHGITPVSSFADSLLQVEDHSSGDHAGSVLDRDTFSPLDTGAIAPRSAAAQPIQGDSWTKPYSTAYRS